MTYGGLVLAADGSFYGTSQYTRLVQRRADFQTRLRWVFFPIAYPFSTRDQGESPFAGLTLGPGGSLYGTTLGGGAFRQGTIFKFDTTGALYQAA